MENLFYSVKFIAFLLLVPAPLLAQRPSFTLNHDRVETNEYAEITLHLPAVKSEDPCVNVLLTGLFISPTNDTVRVQGSCDAPTGNTHRIRFMPTTPGTYRFIVKSYAIRRRQIKNVLTTGRAQTGSYSGTITATKGTNIRAVNANHVEPDVLH